MKNSKVVMVGTGRIAYSLENDPLRYKPCTHLGALMQLYKKKGGFEIAGLCDINPENLMNAANFVSSFQKPATLTPDYHELLKLKPDIMIIASSTKTHFPILSFALKHKIKKIVIEKPICETKEEALELQQFKKNRNTKIWVNYERRHHPKYISLKENLRSGKWGRVKYYRGIFLAPGNDLFPKQNDNHKDEGVLLHDTTHLLDLAMFLFDKPLTTSSHLQKPNGPEHTLFLNHPNNVSGKILTLAKSPAFHFELEIMTEKNRIRVGNGFFTIEKVEKSKHYKNFFSFGEMKSIKEKAMTFKSNPFVRLYQKVLTGSNDTKEFQSSTLNVAILSGEQKEN